MTQNKQVELKKQFIGLLNAYGHFKVEDAKGSDFEREYLESRWEVIRLFEQQQEVIEGYEKLINTPEPPQEGG